MGAWRWDILRSACAGVVALSAPWVAQAADSPASDSVGAPASDGVAAPAPNEAPTSKGARSPSTPDSNLGGPIDLEDTPLEPGRRGGWVHKGFHHRLEVNLGWGGFRLSGNGLADWQLDNPDRGPYADGLLLQVISRQDAGVGHDWTVGGYVSGVLGWNLTSPPTSLTLITVGAGLDVSRYLTLQNLHFDASVGPQLSFFRADQGAGASSGRWGFAATVGVVQDVWFSDHNAFGIGLRAELGYSAGEDLQLWMGGATLVFSVLTTKRPLGSRGE